jgi:hypothetical protein
MLVSPTEIAAQKTATIFSRGANDVKRSTKSAKKSTLLARITHASVSRREVCAIGRES